LNASTRVLELNAGKPALYWLHSLLMVLLSGFGGGFVTPLLIGKPSSPITNDLILPISFLVWYLVHYVGLHKFFMWLPMRLIWSLGLGLFRMNSCCNIVDQANEILKPGPYYPHPIVGPIFTGTAMGCVGQFFPLDKGLSPVEKGTPWAMQGAFLSATIYQIMVYDTKGFVGDAARATFGTHSKEDIRVFLASMHMVTLVAQAVLSQDFNLFAPVHKVLYFLTQINEPVLNQQKSGTVGWAYSTRKVFEKCMNWLRLIMVVVCITTHVTISQAPTALHPGSILEVGHMIGTCQVAGSMRGCSPYLLTLEAQRHIFPDSAQWITVYRLASYNGYETPNSYSNRFLHTAAAKETLNSVLFEPLDSKKYEPIWTLVIDSNSPGFNMNASTIDSSNTAEGAKSSSAVGLVIGYDGSLRLVESNENEKIEKLIWVSNPHCPKMENSTALRTTVRASIVAGLQLHRNTGKPYVKCPDSSIFDL
jgi:hypothetical protein